MLVGVAPAHWNIGILLHKQAKRRTIMHTTVMPRPSTGPNFFARPKDDFRLVNSVFVMNKFFEISTICNSIFCLHQTFWTGIKHLVICKWTSLMMSYF